MYGLDHFVKEFQNLKSAPSAVLSNQATLSNTGYPAAYELLRQGFSIKKLFSPEHGISSQGEDGMEQKDDLDSITKLPIVSLYGRSLRPQKNDLEDIETVIIDLPNIGCRFYTYWWTITYLMEACADLGKKIILLDRQNLSRRKSKSTDGPMLDEKNCSSFLGRWSMPLTYAYSYGQLAKWFVHERKIALDLQIVPYSKNESYPDLPFVPPSPSINEWQTTLIYPCTGLFEGLNLNTGRGTSFPFRVIGAPWLNSIKLYNDFLQQDFHGVQVFPYTYQPTWSRYAGEPCHGLYFYVNYPDLFKPVQTGIWLMNYLSINFPSQLKEATYPTAANPSGENHMDRLLGISNSYAQFCTGRQISLSKIASRLDVSDWNKKVDSFLGIV